LGSLEDAKLEGQIKTRGEAQEWVLKRFSPIKKGR
jgi:hypothetical protein